MKMFVQGNAAVSIIRSGFEGLITLCVRETGAIQYKNNLT